MPKKVVKKPAKKAAPKVAKKVPAKKAVSRSVKAKSSVRKSEHPLTKRYLHAETEDFYARHPNVKPLLILFLLVATAVFIYLVKLRIALATMMY